MKINIKIDDFPDIVISFLLDKIINNEIIIPEKEEFNKIAKNLEGKGFKSIFLKYFMSMNKDNRLKYKRIKDIFINRDDSIVINIEKKEKK